MNTGTPAIPVRDLLALGLRVSVGCTEPAMIAFAAAHAARAALGDAHPDPAGVNAVVAHLRLGVYKNALAVPIPNAGGRCGAPMAAAMGIACDPEHGLSLLASIPPADLQRALRMLERGVVTTALLDDPESDDLIRVEVRTRSDTGYRIVAGAHDRIVLLERNGSSLPLPEVRAAEDEVSLPDGVVIADLVRAIDRVPLDDLARIDEGLRINREAMSAGLALGEHAVGATLGRTPSLGIGEMAAAGAAAAADARMTGVSLPVMTSCGSGNQGILIHIPIAIVAEHEGITDDRVLRAIALAQVVCRYATDRIGLLSPLCGLYAKAGVGVAAGFCYLLGGDAQTVGRAIRLMVAGHAGTVCDGAAPSCSTKMAAAAQAALRSARMAIGGIDLASGPGVASETAEAAVRHVAALAASMHESDRQLFERLRLEAEGDAGR